MDTTKAPSLDEARLLASSCIDRMQRLIKTSMFDDFAVTQFELELDELQKIASYLEYLRKEIVELKFLKDEIAQLGNREGHNKLG